MTATVYFMYDEDDEPLYVGATTSIERRLPEHRGKVFWPQVQTIGLVHFDTWDEAFAYEQDAIRELEPPHNVAGTERMIPIARSAAIKAWKERKFQQELDRWFEFFEVLEVALEKTKQFRVWAESEFDSPEEFWAWQDENMTPEEIEEGRRTFTAFSAMVEDIDEAFKAAAS